MSGRPLLAAGEELTRWLRLGGRPDRAHQGMVWLYRWRAFWLERSYTLLKKTGPAAHDSAFPDGEGLIFIQGFWRAGTTLFHELLEQVPNCAAPRTWQCMDPSAMLTPGGRPSGTETIQRPMDQVMISANSPQEDEFALMAMGVPSVYRGFLDPRRLPELKPFLASSFWTETDPAWFRTLDAFLAWCRDPARKYLVVKSPNHVFRSAALAPHYPKARFVWIFRDPMELWPSNLKMWQAMIARYALWNPHDRELEDFLEAALLAYSNILEDALTKKTFRHQPAFSFEALVKDPAIQLPSVIDRLGLGPWESIDHKLQGSMLAKPKQTNAKPAPLSEGPIALLNHLRELQEAILLESRNKD
jgi:hypothetical protein